MKAQPRVMLNTQDMMSVGQSGTASMNNTSVYLDYQAPQLLEHCRKPPDRGFNHVEFDYRVFGRNAGRMNSGQDYGRNWRAQSGYAD